MVSQFINLLSNTGIMLVIFPVKPFGPKQADDFIYCSIIAIALTTNCYKWCLCLNNLKYFPSWPLALWRTGKNTFFHVSLWKCSDPSTLMWTIGNGYKRNHSITFCTDINFLIIADKIVWQKIYETRSYSGLYPWRTIKLT